jgi:hypothetical protein
VLGRHRRHQFYGIVDDDRLPAIGGRLGGRVESGDGRLARTRRVDGAAGSEEQE